MTPKTPPTKPIKPGIPHAPKKPKATTTDAIIHDEIVVQEESPRPNTKAATITTEKRPEEIIVQEESQLPGTRTAIKPPGRTAKTTTVKGDPISLQVSIEPFSNLITMVNNALEITGKMAANARGKQELAMQLGSLKTQLKKHTTM